MMLILRQETKSEYITIEDVREGDERLEEGFGVRFGSEVHTSMAQEKFLEVFKRAIKKGYITSFNTDRAGIYHITYLESDGTYLRFKEVDLNVSKTDSNFRCSFLNLWENYRKHENRYGRRVYKRLRMAGCPSDILFKCSDLISTYSATKQIPKDLNVKEANEFYARMMTHQHVLKNVPMKISPISKDLRMAFWATVFVFAAVCICSPFIFVDCWKLVVGVLTLVMGYTSLDAFTSDYKKRKNREMSTAVDKFRIEYGNKFGKDFNTVLNKNASLEKKKGLVDIIKNQLKYDLDEDIREKLVSLSRQYSEDRDAEMFSTDKKTDRYRYVMQLIDVESEYYARRDNDGLVPKTELNEGNFLEIMSFLGWMPKKVCSDEFLISIMDAIREISLRPYRGVESEILSLIKLAVQYVGIGMPTDNTCLKLRELSFKILDKAHLRLELARRLENDNEKASIAVDLEDEKRIAFAPVS